MHLNLSSLKSKFAVSLFALGTAFCVQTSLVQAQAINMETLGPQIRAYLIANPDIVMDALAEGQRLEEEREAAAQMALFEAMKPQIFNSASSPIMGDPNGTATIVEFFDYQCGYCKRAAEGLFEAMDKDGKVRLVLKELPILGPESLVAAKAALAAGMQGQYEPMHRALISYRGRLSTKAIMGVADRIGIDTKKLVKDMESPEVLREIAETRSLAEALQINGTPAFIANDTIIPGALPTEALFELVEAERQG